MKKVPYWKGDTNKDLNLFFKNYIVPTLDSVKHYEEKEARTKTFRSLSTTRTTITPRAYGYIPQFTVTINSKLYPNADKSKEILLKNKNAYEEMMATMRDLEQKNFKEYAKTVTEQKEKLNIFRKKARSNSNLRGNKV